MINIKIYTKNKKTGKSTSEGESSDNVNASGGGGSWLEKYFVYDPTLDAIICRRKLASIDNVVAKIETDSV